MFIDTHCHLNFHAFKKDLPDVVRRAKEAGVEQIIVPGTDLSSSRKAIEIAKKYPECVAAIGIHPHHAHDPNLTVDDKLRHELEMLLRENRVVAVGEIGLDYYRYTKTKYEQTEITFEIKQKQKDLFLLQFELAVIHNLPVIFHCREAHDDMIQVIRKLTDNAAVNQRSSRARGWKPPARGKSGLWQTNSRNSPASNNYINHDQASVKTNYIKPTHPPAGGPGVWHCFGGNAKQLQDILTMGYYVGFDGNITYNEDQYSPLVKATPLNRLLLETDSPFLTPVPYRGTRNEPAYLPLVAEAVAKYHSFPLSEVIHISTENAKRLFLKHYFF